MAFARLGLLTLIGALLPGAAAAGLEICNGTDVRQSVAVGYKSGEVWSSEGWWNLAPGACATPVKGDLTQRYYYYRAEATGRVFHDDDVVFCTQRAEFTIAGYEDCTERGYERSLFRKIDTGPSARQFTLTLQAAETRETHGEPYAARAVFQECLTGDGGPYCAFHADGTKVYVYDDGRTSSGVWAVLRGLLPGDPIAVEGDLVEVFDATAEVVLTRVDRRQPNREDTVLERLQGEWYATDDPNARFTVLGAERINTYDGVETGTDWLSFVSQCDGFTSDPPYLAARNPEGGDTLCYAIDRLDGLDLSLIYLPRGNFLDYRRLD